METKINLIPLVELLKVEGISASEMSNLFDELSYWLHQNRNRVANGGFVAAYRSPQENRPIPAPFARITKCFSTM